MKLTNANEENLSYLLKKIGEKLDIVNASLLDPQDYDLNKYEDLKWLYDYLENKDSISASEVEAFIGELAKTRK